MNVHECVSFLLIDQKQVLLETRSMEKACDPGLICIPGGHMESGEKQLDTLFRELEEELAVKPESYRYLCSLYHPTSELQLIHYYVVDAWSGDMKALEADEVNWYAIDNAPVSIDADRIALSEYQRLAATFSQRK